MSSNVPAGWVVAAAATALACVAAAAFLILRQQPQKRARPFPSRSSSALLDVASLPSIFEDMNQMWSIDPQRLPIPADLPRLARRIAFQSPLTTSAYPGLATYPDSASAAFYPASHQETTTTTTSGGHDHHHDAAAAAEQADEERRTQRARRQRLADVVMCGAKSVRRHLRDGGEEEEQMDGVVERLEEMMAQFVEEEGADGQLALVVFLRDSGAYACGPLMGLFKLVQQRAIYAPAFRIKLFLRELGLMTKDMHGPNAWRIFVDFERGHRQRRAGEDEAEGEDEDDGDAGEEGEVVVTHTRREKSSANREEDPEHYFEVEWRLTLVTDRRLATLVRVDLAVIDFEPHPRMPDPLRAHIRDALARCCAP